MKYPIGIQSFEQIVEDGYVYVDKTDLVYRLVTEGKVYFLSRPRRFGKSLLVSTLKNYFLGRKELFRGLAIDRLEQEWNAYPVFHVDFNGTDFTQPDALKSKVEGLILRWEATYGSCPYDDDPGTRFAYVLEQAYLQTGRRAVVLIDEYDKPILDVLDTGYSMMVNGERRTLEDVHRDVLRSFYGVFKSADPYLRFVFLTGVTKFSQVSVFSGFNQPADISMVEKYEALCGITEEELYAYFKEPIGELAEAEGCTVEEMKLQLKHQYDGYHFSARMTDIYNPFSLLNCFAFTAIDDYWFRSGTPTYLVRLLNHSREDMNNLTGNYFASSQFIDYKADVEKPLPMIYQSGYLTIKGYNRTLRTFLLDYPNNEVRRGFLTMVATDYLKPSSKDVTSWMLDGVTALQAGDIDLFRRQLTAFLADIPYTMRRKENERERERYFHYTFYLLLRLLSNYVVYTEKQQSEGRVDCIIETDRYIYIFEFKLDGTAAEALQQIEEKGYAKPYAADTRTLYRIGVSFSSETGTIEEFEVC